jgi:LuxR family maltose regulon positive regulatory protein
MPKRALYRVSWSFERQAYLLSEPTGEEDVTLPRDAAQWLGWLEKHHAFAFDGRSGHLSLLKEWRRGGSDGYWYAYMRRAQRKLKRYVGRSKQLTMERLEEIALRNPAQRGYSSLGFPLSALSELEILGENVGYGTNNYLYNGGGKVRTVFPK